VRNSFGKIGRFVNGKMLSVGEPQFDLYDSNGNCIGCAACASQMGRFTRRKAVIVNAVRSGVISLEEVCRRYELSVEEFLAWQRALDTHGVPGLRVTRLQIHRDNPPSCVAKPRC
jgi:hypothetical protein